MQPTPPTPLTPEEGDLAAQVMQMEQDFNCTITLMHPRDRQVTTTFPLTLPSGTRTQAYLLIGTLSLNPAPDRGFYLAIGSEDWFLYPLPAEIALNNLAI